MKTYGPYGFAFLSMLSFDSLTFCVHICSCQAGAAKVCHCHVLLKQTNYKMEGTTTNTIRLHNRAKKVKTPSHHLPVSTFVPVTQVVIDTVSMLGRYNLLLPKRWKSQATKWKDPAGILQ